jgi:exopolysaccharide production protein ExoQ
MHSQSPQRPRSKLIKLPGGGERFFTICVLLLASGAFTSLMGGDDSAPGKGVLSIVMQAVWSLIYLVTLILLRRGCKGLLDVVRKDKLLFLLVTLAMVSLFWSDDPVLTFRRSLALIGTTLFGVYFGLRFTLADQLKLLSQVFAVSAILSVIMVAILPQYGLASPEFGYAWQGIYGHKNVLGGAMALSVIVFTLRAISDKKSSLRWWVAAGLAVPILVMAHSSTGLVACAVAVATLVLAPALRWSRRRAVIFFLGVGALVVGAAVWAVNNLPYVLSLVSRDPSFTGRTTIWIVSITMITRHPWIGYGYSEFWPGYGSDMVSHLTGLAQMSHAHSAILNLWLDVGLLGVMIFILQYFKSMWCAGSAVRHTRSAEWLWPLVYLVFLAAYGVVESVILQRNGLHWILFTGVVIQVSLPRNARLSAVPISTRNQAVA